MDWNRYWLDRTAREMALRNYAASTHECYLAALKAFLTHHRCAPSGLCPDAIGRSLLLCREDRGLNPSSVNLILAALVFFYQYVVKAPYCIAGIPRKREDQKLPDVLEAGTDSRFIQALLRHSSSKTTERYTHVTAGNLGRVVSPMDRLRGG